MCHAYFFYFIAIAAVILFSISQGRAMDGPNNIQNEEEEKCIDVSLPVEFFPQEAPCVRLLAAAEGLRLVSVSKIIDVDPPPPDPDVEFDLNQVVGVTRTAYESNLYLVHEDNTRPLANLTISRLTRSARENEKAYDLNQDSRLLDAYFDGERLVMLFSFFDGQLYLATGSIDIETQRVLDYSKTILIGLDHTERHLFPAQSDLAVDESGEASVRVRVSSPVEGQEPQTLTMIPVVLSGGEDEQEVLSAEEFKRLRQEYFESE